MRPILYVEANACQTCDTCKARSACKTRALHQFERGDLPTIEIDRCLGCLLCIPACPHGAVRRVEQHAPHQPRAGHDARANG